MRSRTFIVATALAAVLVLAGGLYVYDGARADEIAKGVAVGDVDLSSLTREQARAKLQREILGPLREPIVVRDGDRTWKLGPREARISANLTALVDQALARSRRGNLLTRSLRLLSGGSLDERLQPTVRYSDAAIVRLVDRVSRAVDRPARDATVKLSGAGVRTAPGRDGLAVRADELRRQVRAAIASPSAGRTFVARTRHMRPQVTMADLARKYATVVIVNRDQFRLRLYKGLKLVKTYPIAVGRVGLETPAGLYTIQNKAVDPAWYVPNRDWAGDLAGKVIPSGDPRNPIKARWMGIYDGAGIHGTSEEWSLGSRASHGCIRMRIRDVKQLYDRVPLGAPVYIA